MFGVLYAEKFWLGNGLSHFRAKTFPRIIPQTCPQPSSFYTHLPAYEGGTECSETSAYQIQTPGNRPKESIQHSGHGKSLKSRTTLPLPLHFLTMSGRNVNRTLLSNMYQRTEVTKICVKEPFNITTLSTVAI